MLFRSAVTWDQEHGFRRWFEGDAKSLVAELEKHSRIITYNGNRCDLEVLRGYVPNHKLLLRSFDLHVDLQKRVGHRVKLDSLAQDTLGRGKTGSGEEVVSWWRQGEKEKVCQYCENDVQLLIDLVDFARRMGYVNVDYGRVPVSW